MPNNIIDGNPTKKFFIDMITRDISIEDAIIDLLDNSIIGKTKSAIFQNEKYNFWEFPANPNDANLTTI